MHLPGSRGDAPAGLPRGTLLCGDGPLWGPRDERPYLGSTGVVVYAGFLAGLNDWPGVMYIS